MDSGGLIILLVIGFLVLVGIVVCGAFYNVVSENYEIYGLAIIGIVAIVGIVALSMAASESKSSI